MASTIVRKGKLHLDVFYKPQLIKNYKLHRDFSFCLSLRQARQLYENNQEVIQKESPLPFLQYLNNFPFSYINRSLNGPLNIILQVCKLDNLSMYESQLKLAVLMKLKEYLSKSQKEKITELIKKTDRQILSKYSKETFDFVHAFNYIHLNKQFADSCMLENCVNSIKYSSYTIQDIEIAKVISIFIFRLKMPYWNILRKLDFINDFIVYKMTAKEPNISIQIIHLENYSELQLHLIGYEKIPRYVQETFKRILKYVQNNRLQENSVISAFSLFKYLPIDYNQEAYQVLKKLLIDQTKKNRSFHINKLPFNRMKENQIIDFFNEMITKENIEKIILFSFNQPKTREYFKKSSAINILYEYFCKIKEVKSNNVSIIISSSSLLVEAFQNDPTKLNQIRQKFSNMISFVSNQVQIKQMSQYLPLASIFNLIDVARKLKINHKQNLGTVFFLFSQRDREFTLLPFIDNVQEGVALFHDSQNPQIIVDINKIVTSILEKNDTFYFKYFSNLVFFFQKSKNRKYYKKALEMLYSKLVDHDCPYLVELYNRFPEKNHQMHLALIKQIWRKHNSFRSIGKFMFTKDYKYFRSSNGFLIKEFKFILEELQQLLTLEDIKTFKMSEIKTILLFLCEFGPGVQGFTQKFMKLSFDIIDSIDLERQGPKLTLNFIESFLILGMTSTSLTQICRSKVMNLIDKANKVFPNEVNIKLKQVETRVALEMQVNPQKTHLLVSEVTNALSNEKYDSFSLDVMISLLKLYGLEAIYLPKKNIQQLKTMILENINYDNNQIKTIGFLYPIVKYNVNQLNRNKFQPLIDIIIKYFQHSDNHQSFQFYRPFIKFAGRVKNKQLLKATLNKIVHNEFYSSQIITIFSEIKYFSEISANYFYDKIIYPIHLLSSSINIQLTQILFTLHLARNHIPNQQRIIYEDLLNRSQEYLLNEIKQKERSKFKKQSHPLWIPNQVLKSLWISIKTNSFNQKSKSLFTYLQTNDHLVQKIIENKYYQGLQYDLIYYIYPVCNLKFHAQMQTQQESNPSSIFHSKYYPKKPKVLIEPCQNLTKTETQQFQNSLLKLSLKKISQQTLTLNEDNIFKKQVNIKDIFIIYWIKKDKKQYGCFLVNHLMFNEKGQERGRLDFYKNALNIITGLQMIPIAPGKDIMLE